LKFLEGREIENRTTEKEMERREGQRDEVYGWNDEVENLENGQGE
jgi:hypothetical protein